MQQLIAFDLTTGKITQFSEMLEFDELSLKAYDHLDVSTLLLNQPVDILRMDKYVKEDAVAERPTFTPTISPASIPADGVSIVAISGFPADSILTISGPINETWNESETSTELTVDLPGTYKVRIENWPHQDVEVTFNAT